MTSKLLFLLMNWEIFNQLPALEQVRAVIKALQTSIRVLFAKIVSNVKSKTSSFLAKD